jgi:cystathionine beta-lyase/cystathionine gamma-synthase
MERHSSNALHIAQALERHENVRTVNYPGLERHAAHAVASRQMRAYGGMLSFDVEGGIEGALRTINALQFCSLAPTLGDVDTMVLHPATSSHVNVDREVRLAAGITDGLIRVSVGIEHPDDILGDLLQAIG